MSQALISVVLPVYNSEQFIYDAVLSISNQTYKNIEILIIVNGTTDNSIAEINKIKDDRIRIIEIKESIGLIKALNIGIKESSGKYIARMDADDISAPERIEKQAHFLEKNKDYGLCSSWFKKFGIRNSIVKYETEDHKIKLKLLHECHVCHPSVLIRKSILDAHNLKYPIGFPHSEDYALWIELTDKTKFYTYPEILLNYRDHDNNISKIENKTQQNLSVNLKKQYFEKLGCNLSKEEISIYCKFAYSDFSISESEVKTIDIIITKIFSNLNPSIISEDQLKEYFAQKWNTLIKNSILNKKVLSKIFSKSYVFKKINSSFTNAKTKLKIIIK